MPCGGFVKRFPLSLTTEYLLANDLSIAFNASAEFWLMPLNWRSCLRTLVMNLIAVLSQYQGELLPGLL